MRLRSLKPSRALLRLLERKDFALITVKELRRDCPEDVETLSAFLSRHVPQGQ